MPRQFVYSAEVTTDDGLTYSVHRTSEAAHARLVGEGNAYLVTEWDWIYNDGGAGYAQKETVEDLLILADQLEVTLFLGVVELEVED